MNSIACSLVWKFRRVQLPLFALLAFLQRLPVLRVVLGAESAWVSGSLGQVLRSTALVATAVGAVDTLAGATTFSATPASPASATAGTAFQAAFAVTGAPSTVASYTVSGLPAGLTVPNSTVSGANLVLNASTGTITGTPTTAGNYAVSITAWEKTGGTGKSKGYTYTVNVTGGVVVTAPSITTQPTNQTVTAGGAVSFSVTASGTAPLSYQWQKGGTDIAGATSTTYSIASAASGDAGTYTVVVSNSAGSVTSSGATLTVNTAATAPSITTQPTSQTVTAGTAVSFSVSATGTAPLSYQWRKDGANISGATSATYSIASAASGDAGSYTVVVSNSAGSATSNAATLTISASATAPSITTQPTSQTVTAGTAVSFSVSATGTAPLSYQWRKDGANISGATSATYSIASAASGDAGSYTVVVTNSAGSATSSAATLTVSASATAPSITTQPTSQTVTAGTAVSLSVSATGTAPLSYQWRKDGANISGATSATYSIASAASGDAGSYTVVVSNSAGSATSSAATLTVSTSAASIFPHITALTFDGSGRLYATDSSNNTVQRISSDNLVYLVAGSTGVAGSANGSASAARFNQPGGLVAATDGTLYVADTANALIRRIATDGTVTTLAGNAALRGNVNGTGAAATFSAPAGLALDASGNLYVADATNHTIRKVTSAGVVTTYAGQAGSAGTTNGGATSAKFNNPTAVAVDGAGNVYVADTNNNTIRKISTAGTVTTFAGVAGISGAEDGSGSDALFNQPQGLAFDASGNLYVADTGNSSLRKITAAGAVTTVAGVSTISAEDDEEETKSGLSSSLFNHPQALAIATGGTLYVGDTGAAAVRTISASGSISTLTLTAAPSSGGSSSGSSGGSSGNTGGSSSSGGSSPSGGGGGAPSVWLPLAVLTVLATRRRRRKPLDAR